MGNLEMKLRQARLGAIMLLLTVAALLSACVTTIPQVQHEHDGHDSTAVLPAEMGEVDFPISCTAEAQAEFNRGMAYLHSFWFGPAVDSFQHTAELDPDCAMAYWGDAMGRLSIPWSPIPDQAVQDGLAALESAAAAGAQTPREQAYVDAVSILYRDAETVDYGTRTKAYAAAMEQLASDNPDDTEAQILHALALLMTASPADKTYANQRKASQLLEPILVANPNHPGVAHYLVHSYDYPSLAEGGLDAAQRFAQVAPAAPHALHMPSHIFTRLGYWEESIATNNASAEAAKADSPASYEPGASSEPALHAMDYMMYAYLQLAQDGEAQRLMAEVQGIETVVPAGFGAAYALAAIPARYALERGQWADAAELTLSPASFPWDRFPQAEAVLVFARGLGAARSGDVAAARQELDRLQVLREEMVAADQGYWAEQADIHMEAISAWIALAENNPDEAVALMRRAVDLESATEKHPVTPGPILPAQELLGEMLLELDRPDEALEAFEASQEVEPGRFRGLFGAARAAELAGRLERADKYYFDLTAQAIAAEGGRPEVASAKEFLAQ